VPTQWAPGMCRNIEKYVLRDQVCSHSDSYFTCTKFFLRCGVAVKQVVTVRDIA
jgi:hypothetical protein